MLAQIVLNQSRGRNGLLPPMAVSPEPATSPRLDRRPSKRRRHGGRTRAVLDPLPAAGAATGLFGEDAADGQQTGRSDGLTAAPLRRPFTAAAPPLRGLEQLQPQPQPRGSLVGAGLSLPRRRPPAEKAGARKWHGRRLMFSGDPGRVSFVWMTGRRREKACREAATGELRPAKPPPHPAQPQAVAESYAVEAARLARGGAGRKIELVDGVTRPPPFHATLAEDERKAFNHYRTPPWEKSPAWRDQQRAMRFCIPNQLSKDLAMMHSGKLAMPRSGNCGKVDVIGMIQHLRRKVAAGRGCPGGLYVDHTGNLQSLNARHGWSDRP
eukprot:TRINITY_DN13990_c0_g1_i1.p2 TRINITY_DN13990_c0_g1~~TRINITY_DN13990_c0_g1_i1.p2  ORF type:complete len:354 (+),score=86.79 TRINITY_DN13990_c0_g1_i1:89-1063(+)